LFRQGPKAQTFRYFPLTLCPNLVQWEKSNWTQNHRTTCRLCSARSYTNEISQWNELTSMKSQ